LDGGKHWNRIHRFRGALIGNVTMDRRNTGKMYAATVTSELFYPTPDDIAQTIDGGKSWSTALFDSNNTTVSDIEVNTANGTVYVAGQRSGGFLDSKGGVFKKELSSDKWIQVFSGDVLAIALSSKDPKRVYVLQPRTVSWTADGGQHWQEIREGLPALTESQSFSGLFLDETGPQTKLQTNFNGRIYAYVFP
jgi:photosystem II stability/assembly factor-like uncharacterized protein